MSTGKVSDSPRQVKGVGERRLMHLSASTRLDRSLACSLPGPASRACVVTYIRRMERAVGVLCAVVAALLALASPVFADTVLPPDQDPFYRVPAGISGLANGTIIKSRPVTVTVQSVPLQVNAWQVQFKTEDTTGAATAYITTVMVPKAAWTGKGPRPLLSYQTPEDGVGLKCAPSYMLRGGVMAEGSTSADAYTMSEALQRGWIVVAPDYEGPRSMWLGATGAAHGIIDGLKAALAFKPAAISPAAPIGLWGYSGGAVASSEAAQMQPAYAPKLKLAGVALGGNNASVRAAANDFSGSYAGGAIVIGMIGLDRAYPQYHLTQYLNAAGRQAYAASQDDCIVDAARKYPFAHPQQFLTGPDALDNPAFTAVFKLASPLTFPGTPAAPVYDYHATGDELAPIGPDRQLIARFCAAGTKVQAVEDQGGEHILEDGSGAPGAMAYLAARFAGQAAPDNCGRPPARSPRCAGPRASVIHGSVRISRDGVSLRGRAAPGCRSAPAIVAVQVAVARVVAGRCAFLRTDGQLGPAGACTKPVALRASGTRRWRLSLRAQLPRGRYLVFVWARDAAGRRQPHARPVLRYRVG